MKFIKLCKKICLLGLACLTVFAAASCAENNETKEDKTMVIAALDTAESCQELTTRKTTGSVSFDEAMGAAKFTFTEVSVSWYENTIGFATDTQAYQNMKSGRDSGEYAWLAFDLQFEGPGFFEMDFKNFLIFPTGNVNDTKIGKYYQSYFSEIHRYNDANVEILQEQIRAGKWNSIYVPLTDENGLNVAADFFTLFAIDPVLVNSHLGEPVAKNANYWIKNLRFESKLLLS